MTQQADVPMTFAYQAQTVEGTALSGTIDAVDLDQAGRLLANLRLRVIQIEPVRKPARAKPLSGEDFRAFNQQLSQLTAAGLPIEHGLKLIARDMRSGQLARTINEVVAELERGVPLGEAFDKHASRFPPLYGKLITAGVRTNNLSGMLLNLGRHMEMLNRLRGMIWRAISYPIMVILALGVVLLFLSFVVIPQFAQMYRGFGIQLPGATAVLIESSRWLPWVVIGVLAVVLLAPLLWQWVRLMGMEQAVTERVLLPMPLIGPVLQRNMIARWCDAVKLGVQSGMDLPAAIDLAGEAIGSSALRDDGRKLTSALAAGKPVEQAETTRVLPATVAAVMSLGSEQHDLPTMMGTLSDMYQQQAETRLVMIPGVLTPILIIIVAIILGFVIGGLFLPFVTLIRALTG
jgi:type II secretory pathway component PulF